MRQVAIAALLLGSAYAQEPPAEELPPEPVEVEPEVPNYAEGHRWVPVTPIAGDGLVWAGLVAAPEDPRRLVAVDLDGGVWLSTDAGRTWGRVLQPLGLAEVERDRDDEDLLLEAESIAEDFFEAADEEADYGDSDLVDELEDSLDEVQERAGAGEVDQLVGREGRAGLRLGGVAWFHPEVQGLVLLVRGDGTWRSRDGGRTWSRAADFSTATSVATGDGLVVAGSDDGVRYTLDEGRTWIRASGPLDGVRVREVRYDGERWWAATDQGLYTAQDAQSWWKVGDWEADLRTLLVEPGSVWMATDNELLRMDAEGRIHSPSRHPLPGTVRIHRLGVGHLLVAGRDGVWQSRDDGVTWRAASVGLDHPHVHDLQLGSDGPILAGRTGLWQLLPGERVEKAEAPPEETPLGMSEVLEIALTRPGISLEPASLVRRSVIAARLLPRAQVKGRYYDMDLFSGDYVERTNAGEADRVWYVELQFTWNGDDISLLEAEGTEITVDEVGSGELYVLEGEVFDDTVGGLPVAAANVANRGITYRTLVADAVIDLYESRGQLIQQRSTLPKGDLAARTQHELKIMEVTALLDGYTDGAFSAALAEDGDE